MTDLEINLTKEENKLDFFDYLAILIKWRKFIIVNFVVFTLVAIIISLLLPKWYKATVLLLPPKDQSALSSFGSSSSILKNLGSSNKLGGLGQNLGPYNYLAILKSRSAMEAVVNKFELLRVYNISNGSIEDALKELDGNVTIEIQPDDYITVEVYDKDPQRAPDIANYFVEILNSISNRLGTQEAKNNKEFIEKRLEGAKKELRNAEEVLREFQERTGIMIAPEQNNSGISSVAELYGMKAKKEIELATLERNITKDNELFQQFKLELSELNKKLNSIPEIGLESFRLYRNLAVQQKICEYLFPLYEQSKIDEQKNVPVILVLDKAMKPEKKSKPKRMIIVAIAAGISLLFSVISIFIRERIISTLNEDKSKREKIALIRNALPKIFKI